MTPRATTIRIPTPCAESWAAMTPASGGRHCAACAKTVVDFTQKTDAEILAYLAQAAGSQSCGRFRAGQLGRPLQPAATASRWRSWLAAVLALGGILGTGRAAAQQAAPSHNGGPTPAAIRTGAAGALPARPAVVAPAATTAGGAGGPLIVRGSVTDASTGDPLFGVTVVLAGTSQGVSTGANGEFELVLTGQEAADTLLVSFVGYISQPVAVASASAATPLAIKLAADVMGLSEVILVGGYTARKPWPWHPRRLYQWSKAKLRQALEK